MPTNKPPRIIYFWPDSGDEDANCGLWWPEPMLEDAPEAGPGTPAVVVPSDMTEEEARAALEPICGQLWLTIRDACKYNPGPVAVLLAGAIRRMEEKHG